MLLLKFNILLSSPLYMEGWRKLGFCLLVILGSLLTIFNIDIIYLCFFFYYFNRVSKSHMY